MKTLKINNQKTLLPDLVQAGHIPSGIVGGDKRSNFVFLCSFYLKPTLKKILRKN